MTYSARRIHSLGPVLWWEEDGELAKEAEAQDLSDSYNLIPNTRINSEQEEEEEASHSPTEVPTDTASSVLKRSGVRNS